MSADLDYAFSQFEDGINSLKNTQSDTDASTTDMIIALLEELKSLKSRMTS